MKICAYFSQIPNFEYDARSVPVILEHSSFYLSVFTPSRILFKVLQKFLRKNVFSIHPNPQPIFFKSLSFKTKQLKLLLTLIGNVAQTHHIIL